jgi:hypothetical protein
MSSNTHTQTVADGPSKVGPLRVRCGSEAVVPRLNLKVGFPDSSRLKIRLVGLDSANSRHSTTE